MPDSANSLPLPASGFANDLARGFFEFMGPPERDPSEIELVVLDAAQTLADDGFAGDWERFDAVKHLRRLAFLSPHEQEGIALDLVALFVYLTFIGWVEAARAREIIEAIDDHVGGSSTLSALVASARTTLSGLSAADEGN